jgi:geranylgeranyl reductase family protein
MKNRQRIRGAGLAVNRDQHTTPGGQRIEDPSIVRLKSHLPHGRGDAELGQVATISFERGDQRPARQHGADHGKIDPIAARSAGPFDELGNLRALLGQHGQRFAGEPGLFERLQSLPRPRHVLKDRHGEPAGIDSHHERVMYHGDLWKLRFGYRLATTLSLRGTAHRNYRHAATVVVIVDVAVVGGGPAGAWTARQLARRGVKTLLLDHSHPRDKPCGGGVTGRALQIVEDAVDVAQFPGVAIRSARFGASTSPRACDVPLSPGRLVVASRREFDGRLFEAARRAGAQIVASRARSIRRTADGFEVDTVDGQYRAGWLVGADGANSLVRRRVSESFRRDQLSVATGFYAHGVTSDEIVIEFVADPPGYIWSFPRPDHLAIGICAQADGGVSSARLRDIAAKWMTRTHIADGAECEPYSWPIPSLPPRDLESLQPAGPGWMLVGDAAGLVDPLTREGIYFALRSATLAADAIFSADAQSWTHYARVIREECGAELARAARLKNRFFRPEFTGRVVDALVRSASVRAVMADLVSGDQGYATLKWRLVKTLNLGLATKFFFGRSA